MIDDFRKIRHITILGVGLIGGSLGLALKSKGFDGEIVGLGRRMSTLEIAQERDAVDTVTTDFEQGLRNADLVIVGTPVELIPVMVKRIGEIRKTHPKPLLITDVGSVKGQIVASIEQIFINQRQTHIDFVGSHPMAGSERTGVSAARADLFEGAKCIVTPTHSTPPQIQQTVRELWKFAGCETYLLTPAEHDILIAGASHLPHLVASVLTDTVETIQNDAGCALDFTATGFRDTTRIAAGSPELWTHIFMQNAEALTPMIDQFIENLNQFKVVLQTRHTEEMTRVLAHSKSIRDALEDS